MADLAPKYALSTEHVTTAAVTQDPEAVDLRQVFGVLAENRRLVVRIAGVFAAVLLIIPLLSTMRFRTSSRLYLGELNGQRTSASEGEVELAGDAQGDVGSEVEILRSRSLAQRAVLASGFNVSLSREGDSPVRLWRWLASGRDPKLIDGVHAEVRAIHTQLDVDEQNAQSFSVRVLKGGAYELWSSDEGPEQAVRGMFGQELRHGSLQLTLLSGAAVRPGMRYDLTVHPLDHVLERVMDDLMVSVPKAASGGEPVKVVHAEFTATSPKAAADYLKALMLAYLSERQSWKTENATAAESFVTQQLEAMRSSLDAAERKRADYRSNTRGVVAETEAKAMIEQIGKYEEQRVAARLEVASLLDMRRMLANPRAGIEAFFVGESSDTVLQGLAASLTKARQELTELEGRFSAAAPDVRNQRHQVESQLRMVRNYVNGRLARAQENLNGLDKVVQQFETRLKTVPGAELQLAQLAREADVFSRMYSFLLERQQQAAIVKASTVSKNRILDEPKRSYVEDSPRLGLRLLSCLLGFLFGALVVLLRHALGSAFVSVADVARTIRRPILGEIPAYGSATALGIIGASTSQALVASGSERPPAHLNAVRQLRSNLYHATSSHDGRVVLIASPESGDGKTTCTIALATALSSDGKLVLIIDADLRTPSLHERFGLRREPGLGSILRNTCDWSAAIQPVAAATGEFHIMSAGAPASAELLLRGGFARLLEIFRTRYDYVILDCGNSSLGSYAPGLAQVCDFALTVVRLGTTSRKGTLSHVRQMELNAPRHAVVVNRAPHMDDPDLSMRIMAFLQGRLRRSRVTGIPGSSDAAKDTSAEPAA